MKNKLRILFLCVANSARSQLAEGLAKIIFAHEAIIESAGSQPSGIVHPWAIKVLKADGIDVSTHSSKSVSQLDPVFLNSLDYIITLCADEICPIVSSQAQKLHWPLTDPSAAPESEIHEAFLATKNELKDRLIEFKKSIQIHN